MASCAANFVRIFNFPLQQATSFKLSQITANFLQVRNYAARKGTRERKLKLLRAQKSKKQEEKKKDFKGKRQILVPYVPRRNMEERKPSCEDDIIVCRYYRWQVYSLVEAIQCHRETHHPTIYNVPDAFVKAHIELDMTAAKKNRYVDGFTRIVAMPHIFLSGEERSVLVFCKTEEIQNEAKEAGADLVGDIDLIKSIEKGDLPVNDFDYVIAHPNIIPDLVPIRGLIKKVFPNVRQGTLGNEVASMVRKFRHGIKYTATRDEREQDYGLIEAYFGKLDMEVSHLQENLQTLLQDIYSVRPKRPGRFLTRVVISSAPSVERLKVDLSSLLPEQVEDEAQQKGDDSDEEEIEAVTRKAGQS